MVLSINLTEEEKNLANSYAAIHSISVSDAFKKALFEKIEDEYDAAIGDEAYEEYLKDGKKGIPIQVLWEELEITALS